MDSILEVNQLSVSIKDSESTFNIVEKIDFSIGRGEIVGIVGESGCGKSITSLSIMGLLPSNAITNGEVRLNGRLLSKLKKNDIRKIRGKEMAMIFQEPMTSLNPVYNIGFQISELIKNHTDMSKKEIKMRVLEMLQLVGIPRADEIVNEYPHQLSGGMRQRVMIAMAMSCNPDLLIADEPTTALDVTIQAQILDLMRNLQKSRNMSIMFITHDLGVVAEMCNRVVVMYAGQVVEDSPVEELFENPKHPYTRGLIDSIPNLEEYREYLSSIEGTVPSPKDMPKGCRFADRCPKVHDRCQVAPPLITLDSGVKTRCWLYEDNNDSL